jgi:broad specificity phosphatase PhoE
MVSVGWFIVSSLWCLQQPPSNNNNNNNRTTTSTAFVSKRPSSTIMSAPPTPVEEATTTAAATTTTTTTTTATTEDDKAYHSLTSRLPPLESPNHRRIYLLRHGETDWNLAGKIQGGGFDIPLNDNGRLQAEKAAAELDGIPLGIIASSSLSRAKETADILMQRHPNDNITRIVDDGFNEMRFGEFEGYSSASDDADREYFEYFKTMSRKVKDDPSFPFPGEGGESTSDVQKRSIKALQKVLQEADPDIKHIAIVSHGRTNKVSRSEN